MIRSIAAAGIGLCLAAAPALAESWSRLVGPAELAGLLAEEAVTVLDIRPPREHLTGHVAGAVNAPYPLWRGPEDNPGAPLSDAALTEVMQRAGIEPGDAVVVAHAGIDETDFGAAARVYWTLKSAGLERIAILNGGVRGWIAAGEPLATEPEPVEPSAARFSLSDRWMASREDVAAIVSGERAGTLLDARPEAFFKGEAKHAAAKAPGTLDGARNVAHSTWFPAGSAEIAPADRIAALAGETAGPATPAAETVSFCNTGHWAATTWFAMSELAGREGVKLYPESMVGWVNSGGAVTAGE